MLQRTFIGDCELASKSNQSLRYQTQAVVRCEHISYYSKQLSNSLAKLDFTLIWTEHIKPTEDYLFEQPHKSAQINQLMKFVDDDNPVALDLLQPVKSTDESTPLLLSVQTHYLQGIELDQSYISPSDREIVSSDVLKLIFNEESSLSQSIKDYDTTIAHAKEQALPPIRTYAILNGAEYIKAGQYLPSNLENSGLEYRALLKGDYSFPEQLKMPYLVDLSIEGVHVDFDHRKINRHINNIHTQIFDQMWGKSAVFFVKSRMSFNQMWRHIRTFYHQKDTDDKGFFFFFFYPHIAKKWFPSIVNNESRVKPWFFPRNQYAIQAYLYEESPFHTDANQYVVESISPLEHQTVGFTLPEEIIALSSLQPSDEKILNQFTKKAYRLEDQDKTLFQQQAKEASFEKIIDILKQHLAQQIAICQSNDEALKTFIEAIFIWSKPLGFTNQAQLTQLSIYAVLLGFDFINNPILNEITASLTNTTLNANKRLKYFTTATPTWVEKTKPIPATERYLYLYDTICLLKPTQLTTDQRREIVGERYQQLLAPIAQSDVTDFYQLCCRQTKPKLGQHDFTPAYAACALNFGVNFINDPTQQNIAKCFALAPSEPVEQVYNALQNVLMEQHNIAQEVY